MTSPVDAPHRTSPEAGLVRGLVRSTRPRQWVKNVLVLAAPGAAGVLTDPAALTASLWAVVAFVLVSAGVYLFNDVGDRHEDATHPTKRHRPVAAGVVPVGAAVGVAVVLLAGGLALGAAVRIPLLAVLTGYLGLNAAYGLGLRDVPLLDLALVASGFLLRAVAGAAATGVPVSKWFLIVASFASLYVVASKRFAELRRGERHDHEVRKSLVDTSLEFLRDVRVSSLAVMIGAYVLWAFEIAEGVAGVWYEVSIIPFVLAIYRYAMVVDAGMGEAPEEILLQDRFLQALGVVWLAVFGAGVYVG